jgi:hypothetical protein
MMLKNARKTIAFLIGVTVCLLSSCGLFSNDEPAPTLEIPRIEEITGVYIHSSVDVIADEETIERAVALLESAIPTTRWSVNDVPNYEPMYFFALQVEEGMSSLFRGYIYEVERYFGLVSDWYFEIPYYGVYEVSTDCVLALLEN